MRKIPTVFLRDEQDRRYVTDQPHPDCGWVFAGEGIPTRKYDGTCVMFDGTRWWARREVKAGKMPPRDWVMADHDEITGKSVGWEPVEQSSFAKFHGEAVWEGEHPAGTYELIGPKINGNPEDETTHVLMPHAWASPINVPDLSFDGLRTVMENLRATRVEGIVWHHPDGRMAKLKVRDFPQRGGSQT